MFPITSPLVYQDLLWCHVLSHLFQHGILNTCNGISQSCFDLIFLIIMHFPCLLANRIFPLETYKFECYAFLNIRYLFIFLQLNYILSYQWCHSLMYHFCHCFSIQRLFNSMQSYLETFATLSYAFSVTFQKSLLRCNLKHCPQWMFSIITVILYFHTL